MDLFNLPFFRSYEAQLGWLISRVKNVETSEANAKASEEAAAESASDAAAAFRAALVQATHAETSANNAAESATQAAASAADIQESANQIAVNSAQISSLIANAGDTDGNSELLDIRIAYNGTTYETAGDAVRAQSEDLAESLYKYNVKNNTEGLSRENYTGNGVTATAGAKSYTFTGTSTGVVTNNEYAVNLKFPGEIQPGDVITCIAPSTSSNIYYQVWFRTASGWDYARKIDQIAQFVVPDNATGMLIRWYIPAGVDTEGAVLNFIDIITDNSNYPVVWPSASDTSVIIEKMLEKHGKAILKNGTYHLASTVNMPDGSSIVGDGIGSVVSLTGDYTAFELGNSCSVKNIKITNNTSHSQLKGAASGISIVGNGDNAPYKGNCMIDTVWIKGFTRAGIYIADTGYQTANSNNISNCDVTDCYAGILLENHAEFNRINNCNLHGNFAGYMNKSGNNMLSNSSCTDNEVGVYLMGDDPGYSGNDGHGSISNSVINHSGNNAGYAVIARGIDNMFIFDSCNIWYGKIYAESSNGIKISNSIFGGGTPQIINQNNTATVIINDNLFQSAPTLTGDIINYNNYIQDGTAA